MDTGVRTRPALSAREVLAAYVALTKPRIISLLLITTIPTMIVADGGIPSFWLMLATVVGGSLAAGGANAINCYIDRDIDEIMHRTQGRPLPLGKMEPGSALYFALILEVAAFALLTASSNLLAASLALAATAFYVFVYTLWLKRTTSQNIVIGGAAGAVPPLVAWAAVTGTVGVPALILFAIIFFWTPPHFWALSIKYKDDYARADVPMLPVVASMKSTKDQIFAYTALLVPVSLTLLATREVGWIYAAAAIALGAWFMRDAWRLRSDDSPGAAMSVFKTSITYLALIFLAVALDVMLPSPF
ncbi:MAG: protoheme IX farnesyltransferase [Chloroflexi bacterium]|nr:protoheme IX farnesyltransferase [Chloroflexota bacterium]